VQRGRPTRRKLVLLVGGIVVATTAGTIATALTPALAAHHPLLLIVLDARNRELILARRVDLAPFVVVGTLRRVLTDPLYWLLGWWYGDRAVRWLEHNAGGGAFVRFTERFFSKAAYPMVFLFPGAVVCALAGATGMPFLAFLAVNVAGTVAAVVAVRLSSDLVAGPVDAVVRFFNEHLVATTAVTIGLVVLSLVLNHLQGGAEVPSVDELEAGLELDPETPSGAEQQPEPDPGA
jgi:membrane protein DedA with SNARE-associated domain